jgi:hypothetical protein
MRQSGNSRDGWKGKGSRFNVAHMLPQKIDKFISLGYPITIMLCSTKGDGLDFITRMLYLVEGVAIK